MSFGAMSRGIFCYRPMFALNTGIPTQGHWSLNILNPSVGKYSEDARKK